MKTYVLTHARTGLYFNGTSFSASIETARFFDEVPDVAAVRLIWGPDIEIEQRNRPQPDLADALRRILDVCRVEGSLNSTVADIARAALSRR